MKFKNEQRKKLVALSAIVGVFITIGITVAAGSTLFYAFQSQIDPFTSSSSLEVRNLNAVLDDDTLRLTATIKNSGQTSLTSVFIDTISVTDITITQDDNYKLILAKGTTEKTFCHDANVTGCVEVGRAEGFSLNKDGDTSGNIDVVDSTLEGGRTQALVMEITCGGTCTPDIGDNINISDKLNLVLKFTSGQDELLTDVFTTRIKPG